jgi:hypothetical protein
MALDDPRRPYATKKYAESAIAGLIKDRNITDQEFIKRLAARPG